MPLVSRFGRVIFEMPIGAYLLSHRFRFFNGWNELLQMIDQEFYPRRFRIILQHVLLLFQRQAGIVRDEIRQTISILIVRGGWRTTRQFEKLDVLRYEPLDQLLLGLLFLINHGFKVGRQIGSVVIDVGNSKFFQSLDNHVFSTIFEGFGDFADAGGTSYLFQFAISDKHDTKWCLLLKTV